MKTRLNALLLLLAAALCVAAQAQTPEAASAPSGAASAAAASPSVPAAPAAAASTPATPSPSTAPTSDTASTATPSGTTALGAPGAPQPTNTVNPLDLTNVRIGRVILGSGEPGSGPPESEVATQVYEGLYHAPQYLPYYPTAATIWPRAIEVPCRRVGADLLCDRYFWRPEFGRGEYLFFTPVVQAPGSAAR